MAVNIPMIAGITGIASGVNSMTGGSLFGGGPTQVPSGQADPWGTSGGRSQAAGMLQGLMSNPAQALSMPGFAASRQDQLQTLQGAQAAAGQNNAGGSTIQDANLINQLTTNNYSQYEGILANLAGVQNASQGVQAGMVNQYGQNSGWQGVAQGVGALSASMGNGGNPTTSNYAPGQGMTTYADAFAGGTIPM